MLATISLFPVASSFADPLTPDTAPPPIPAGQVDVPINAPVPPMTIDAGDEQISGTPSSFNSAGQFAFSGGVTVVGGSEFTLRADAITGDMNKGVVTAVGHVYFRELSSYIDFDSLFTNRKVTETQSGKTDSWSGIAQNVVLHSSIYTVFAKKLAFENDSDNKHNEIDLYSGVLTTCPPDQKSDYSIQAALIKYEPGKHRVTIYNGAFYIGKSRIFEFKKLSRRTGTFAGGQGAGDKLFNETFGYTGYNGPFIGYTAHTGTSNNGVTGTIIVPEKHNIGVLVIARTPLLTARSRELPETPKTLLERVRQAVESTEPILPNDDPLMFHWFQAVTTMEDRFVTIPNTLTLDAEGVASYQERVYGHETDDLFYSRFPEGSLIATAPISGPRALPTSHDPIQVRQALKQIALYAVVTPTIGQYYEYPDNISSNREAVQLNVESRPILVGENLLFKPVVSYRDSTYPDKREAFQLLQYDLALEKYVTDETGYGLEFIDTDEHGSSPFQFDTPYTTKELDTRVQYGLKHVILGAVLKYDINGKNLYEEQIMLAPRMRSLIPRFSYDFRDSTFGVGIDIQGLTF